MRDATAMQHQHDQPMLRADAEASRLCVSPFRISDLRALHPDQPGPAGAAVELLRELRDQGP